MCVYNRKVGKACIYGLCSKPSQTKNINKKIILNAFAVDAETNTLFGSREPPCRTTIHKLVEKMELLGQVSDMKNKTCS